MIHTNILKKVQVRKRRNDKLRAIYLPSLKNQQGTIKVNDHINLMTDLQVHSGFSIIRLRWTLIENE